MSMDDLYGGTNRYLRKVADRMNIKTTFVDATNPENVENAIQENTKVFFFSNDPLFIWKSVIDELFKCSLSG